MQAPHTSPPSQAVPQRQHLSPPMKAVHSSMLEGTSPLHVAQLPIRILIKSTRKVFPVDDTLLIIRAARE